MQAIIVGTIGVIGYLANFHAIYSHWNHPLTLGTFAEFAGVFFPPLGVITGIIHIL